MGKEDLLNQLRQARATLLRATEGVSKEEMTISPVVGHWTVKELLAHIAAWDAESLKGVKQLLAGERPHFLDRDWDLWNAQEVERRGELSLSQVKEELEKAHHNFLAFLQGLDEEEWNRSRDQTWRRYKVTVSWIVKGTILHDKEHTRQISAWRKNSSG